MPSLAPAARFRRELLPPARTFYEKEFGRVSRADRKGWAKAACPVHKSKSGKSLSVKVIDGWWHCRGCNVGGDILGFVMWRYGLTFPAAAEYLGALDRDTSASHRAEVLAAQSKLEQQRAEQVAKQEADRRHRLDVRDCLHNLEDHHKRASPRLWNAQLSSSKNKRASFGHDDESEWELLALLAGAITETEQEYYALCGLELER